MCMFPRPKWSRRYDMLAPAIEKIGLPVMVKGCFYKAHRAYTFQEATAELNKLVAEWGYPVIFSRLWPATSLTSSAWAMARGTRWDWWRSAKSGSRRWARSGPESPSRMSGFLEAAERFIRVFRWRGPFELECIVTDDQVYLIEINPRFPAWVYAATGVGINFPSQLLRCSRGLPVATPRDYAAGKLFVRYSYDLVTEMTAFQNIIHRGENP